MTAQRDKILKDNESIRRGTANKPVRLPDGEAVFRIPEQDWPHLMRAFPELAQTDGRLRHLAWKRFRHTPAAERYMVVRSPAAVRRSKNRIIIK